MSEIKINVDLDLKTKKAKDQLDSFKKSVEGEDIPVKLNLNKVKEDANNLKNILENAFKLDTNTLGNLKQVENSLKQINKLIKTQSDLTNKTNSNKSNIFNPITINKNTDIVKDVDTLVDDYKNAKKQLESLDQMGQSMLGLLDDFNTNQKNAFEKFINESKQYDVYLKHLEGDNLTSALKQAIDKRKKAIKLQEELTQLGVIKVNNDQLRNEKYDGSIFTIDNEKWKAMFAKTEGEARDLEDMARKIKPKIDSANKDVLELIKGFSNDERKLFEQISKAYEQRPQFNHLSGFDSDNIDTLKLYLENAIPDVDKMGLDFDRFDDIFRGLDRFYSRLEQMQNEYNSKFANEDGFKPIRLDSLLDIEQNEAKRIIQEAESNNDLLDNVLKNRLNILNKDYAGDNLDLGINESSLKNMEQFINLSKLVNKSISQSSSKESSLSKDVKDYLAVTKKINELQSQLYKSDANGTTSISKSIQNEIDLMRQKQLTYASAIRANKDLYESVKDQIKIEEQLSNLRRTTKETIVDTDALNKLDKTYKELDKIQDKLQSMQNTKGFLDNSLVEKTNSLLSETRSKLDANGIESDFKEISNSVELLNKNLKSLNDNNTLGKQEANFNISLQNMENKIESFIDKCKEMGNAEHLIERVEYAFRSINTDNIERANVDLKQMASVLNQAEREARQLSSTMDSTRSFFGNFSQEFKDNLFTFTAGELLADGIRNVASSLKDLVMEYDTAITNLKKVANPADVMDVSQLEAIEKKAVSIAKNVGQSSQDTIQAIADTIQMGGYSMEQATKIAEQTMMLANVADLTQQVASQGVVTMMSAFNLDPLKEVSVVVDGVTKSTDQLTNAMDILNYTGNQFSISSGGILDAITSGANVLASYGVSMTDTVAMITAANHTLQDTSRVKFLTSLIEI